MIDNAFNFHIFAFSYFHIERSELIARKDTHLILMDKVKGKKSRKKHHPTSFLFNVLCEFPTFLYVSLLQLCYTAFFFAVQLLGATAPQKNNGH